MIKLKKAGSSKDYLLDKMLEEDYHIEKTETADGETLYRVKFEEGLCFDVFK